MEMKDFEVVGWEMLYNLCLELSDRIRASGEKFDLLLGISRGGLIPLRILSDELDNPNIATVKIEFYVGISKTMQEPRITQPPSERVNGKNVLVVDDVADTGKSLLKLREFLIEEGAKTVKLATIFYKPWSETRPDFWIRSTERWIIFPHERREVSLLFLDKMKDRPPCEIRERLIQVGIEPYIVDRVMKNVIG